MTTWTTANLDELDGVGNDPNTQHKNKMFTCGSTLAVWDQRTLMKLFESSSIAQDFHIKSVGRRGLNKMQTENTSSDWPGHIDTKTNNSKMKNEQ